MLVGLSLGVAVVVAIDLSNQSALKAFELSTKAVVGQATHRIDGGPSGLPEQLYRELRVERGIRPSAPIVEGIVTAVEMDQRPFRVLGVDLFAEAPFRDHLSSAVTFDRNFSAFFTRSGTALVGEELAQASELDLGDKILVQVDDRIEEITIIGLTDSLDGSDILLMDIAGAQELLDLNGRLTRIDLLADKTTIASIESWLPAGAIVLPFSEQVETADQLTAAFRLNLTALSLLALVVGLFLVYNTMTFSVLSRRPVFGTLRALGASGQQVFALVVFEATLVGVLGAAVGLGLGLLLSQLSVGLVTQTINDFYYLLTVRDTSLTPDILLKAMGLGVGASVVAALLPALEAARVPPIQVLRRSDVEAGFRRWIPRVWVGGFALAALGAAVFLLSENSLPRTFLGMLIIIVGLALMVPLAVQAIMRMIRPLSREVQWRLATRGVVRQISRTGIAIAALMVALSVAIGVTLMIDSFRATVENWLDITLYSDIYLSSPATIGNRPQANLSPSLEMAVAGVPGVAVVESVRAVQVRSNIGDFDLTAVDPRRVRDADLYRFASGSETEVWELIRNGAVVISESLQFREGALDSIMLETDRGLRPFAVVGVFYDYSSDRGTVLMSRDVYQEFWDDPSISSMGVQAASGHEPAELAERLREVLAGTGLVVQVNQEIRDEAMRIFDRTFAITDALGLLAVIVAFIGVLSALLAVQLERRREFATLEAIGLPPDRLGWMTYLETGLMGLSAAVLAVPTGLLLALLLIHVINVRSFGWTIELAATPAPFIQAGIVGVVASLAAAIYPVSRLRRMTVAEALRSE